MNEPVLFIIVCKSKLTCVAPMSRLWLFAAQLGHHKIEMKLEQYALAPKCQVLLLAKCLGLIDIYRCMKNVFVRISPQVPSVVICKMLGTSFL